MLADSPFALATPPAGPEKPQDPPWSANLYLGPVWRIVRDGVERLGEERGRTGERGGDALGDRDQGVGEQRRQDAA